MFIYVDMIRSLCNEKKKKKEEKKKRKKENEKGPLVGLQYGIAAYTYPVSFWSRWSFNTRVSLRQKTSHRFIKFPNDETSHI